MRPACARCHDARGSSCCEAAEGEALATLTEPEVRRIAAHTGRPAKSFCEDEWLGLEEAREYELRRPLFGGYFRNGPRRLTLRVSRGACVLLDRTSGCVLPPEVRPTCCRLYPLEPWPDGTVSVLAGKFLEAAPGEPACLAVDEAESLSALIETLDLGAGELARLISRLREDVRHHACRNSAGRQAP